jgi:hypothetical protein
MPSVPHFQMVLHIWGPFSNDARQVESCPLCNTRMLIVSNAMDVSIDPYSLTSVSLVLFSRVKWEYSCGSVLQINIGKESIAFKRSLIDDHCNNFSQWGTSA